MKNFRAIFFPTPQTQNVLQSGESLLSTGKKQTAKIAKCTSGKGLFNKKMLSTNIFGGNEPLFLVLVISLLATEAAIIECTHIVEKLTLELLIFIICIL